MSIPFTSFNGPTILRSEAVKLFGSAVYPEAVSGFPCSAAGGLSFEWRGDDSEGNPIPLTAATNQVRCVRSSSICIRLHHLRLCVDRRSHRRTEHPHNFLQVNGKNLYLPPKTLSITAVSRFVLRACYTKNPTERLCGESREVIIRAVQSNLVRRSPVQLYRPLLDCLQRLTRARQKLEVAVLCDG